MKQPFTGNNRIPRSRWFNKPPGYRTFALIILALIIRLIPLGHYVTPDEPIWVLRSVHLLDAVTAGDWAAIPQTGHPGFTTMVLGALGVQLTKVMHPAAATVHLAYIQDIAWLAPESSQAFPHLAFFLNTCRTLIAFACASGIGLIYIVGKMRLGERASRLLALFLALDPFFAGHGGLLHTDALQATFVMLSILCLLPRKDTRQIHFGNLASTAFFLALAGLTKTLGLLIAPGLAFALLLWGGGTPQQRWLRAFLLGLISILFVFVLFPPFWIAPQTAFQSLFNAITYHQGAGLRDVFFAGQFHIDPGPFFYPVVLLFRSTAPVIIGLGFTLRRKTSTQHYAIKWLLVPSIVYILALTFATKKFDRYGLSIVPMLTAIASLQWRSVFKRWKTVLLALLCLPWACVALIPLYGANPLLGGPWLAQYVIPFGWGEGSGFAAQKINRIYDEPEIYSFLTGDIPGVASIFAGQVFPKKDVHPLCADGLISNTAPNYTGYKAIEDVNVSGIHLTTIYTQASMLPEGLPLVSTPITGAKDARVAPKTSAPALQKWLEEHFSGQEFLWIHAPECDPITEAQLTSLLCPADSSNDLCYCSPAGMAHSFSIDQCQFTQLTINPQAYIVRVGQLLDLVAASWIPEIKTPATLDVHLRWTINNPFEGLTTYLALRDTEGLIWAEGSTVLSSNLDWLKSAHRPGNTLDGRSFLPLPDSLPPGQYTLTIGFSDNANRGIGLTHPDGTFAGVHTDLGTVTVMPNPRSQSETTLPIAMDISLPGLHLRAATPPPETLNAGDPLPFHIEVARIEQVETDTLNWALLCDGVARTKGDLLNIPGNAAEWHTGMYYVLRYAPRTDPTLSDQDCTLVLRDGERTLTTLGAIRVRARERDFSLPAPPQFNLEYSIGTFGELVGFDISQPVVTSGETLTVTLYWQAKKSADINYSVFVHLVGNEGEALTQSDDQPAEGRAPTSTWLSGQVIVDYHYLTIYADIPQGEYALVTGLYDPESGYRETPYSAAGERITENQIPIGKIEVID